jgi:Transglycosylase-like domain.
MIDVDLLQTCLDQVQSSLMDHHLPDEAAVAEEETYVADEPEYVADDEPVYDALDAVFAVDITMTAEPAEEVAPIDDGLGGAFAALADCESGGNYSINTGNGYYGAYQFSLSTWQGLGYGGYPHQASPAVQDQAARELQALYGWGQWPGCSWYLGL